MRWDRVGHIFSLLTCLLLHHEFSVLTCLSSSSSMIHSSRSTFCLLPYPSRLVAKLWDVAVRMYSSLVTAFSLCTRSKKRGTGFTSFYYPSLLRHVISHISVPFYLDWLLVLFIFIILSNLYWWVVSTMNFQCWLVFHLPLQWFILHALHSAYFPTVHISLPNFDLGLHIQV